MMASSYKLAQDIPKNIFRAYDIRGIVGETFTPDNIYTIGLAIGSEAIKRGERTIIIGRDGRLSGPELLKALSAGILSSGCNVINIGEVTTPILYYATNVLDTTSGVMLTGSHNPPNYNGIKVVLQGEALYEMGIYNLHDKIVKKDFVCGEGKEEFKEIIDQYLARIVGDVKLSKKLKIVIDCGNGVGGKVAPKLFKALGCDVIELFCEVDGNFPNHHPDPSEEKNLEDLVQSVLANKADAGLAFDGDADRVGVVTNEGKIISSDRLLMFFAIDLLSRKPNATIVFDVKCTRHLADQITRHEGQPLMMRTGHSYIKAKMKEIKALLAGEFSGHTFIKERWYGFDDGIYTGARLLELLAKSEQSLDQLFAVLPESLHTPELKIPMADDLKFAFMEKLQNRAHFPDAKVTTIDGIRADFADGFGLIRPSNTTPYLILRFEGDTKEALDKIKRVFKSQLQLLNPNLKLPY
jgi:phosphomannomutase/phosphoglucomutase